MRTVCWMALVGLMTSGCHAKFKKNASLLGDVQPQVVVAGGPTALLQGGDASASGVVVTAVQIFRASKARDRLQEAVDVDHVSNAFVAGLDDGLSSGIPFGLTGAQDAPVLQVEVISWGLEAPQMGRQGALTYRLRIRAYDRDARRVYATRHDCAVGFGDAPGISHALGTVDNVKQLNKLSNAELQQIYEAGARACGEQLAVRIRRHGAPRGRQPSVAHGD